MVRAPFATALAVLTAFTLLSPGLPVLAATVGIFAHSSASRDVRDAGSAAISSAVPSGVDLDATYIARTPRYDRFATKQWPAPGESVTFTAYIKNKGTLASGQFTYLWAVDGVPSGTATLPSLSAGGATTASMVWAWQPGRHRIHITLDPYGAITETTKSNNTRDDFTDALAIGFWVEQSVYQEFNNVANGSGSYSWEDWAQGIVGEMNWLFDNSRYPTAPTGASTRVRLDKITVVPDGTLFDLNWQHAPIEGTTDVQWGFSVDEYSNCSMECQTTPWWVDHELMHYLYGRIDLYAFDVQAGDVKVKDDTGHLIAGTPALPYLQWDVVHYARPNYDLMHHPSDSAIFSDYTIYGLNRAWPAGARLSVVPWDTQFNQVPTNSQVRVLDTSGNPMSGVTVSIYKAVPGDGTSGPYSQLFDNVADVVGTTNSQGLLPLGSQPFGNIAQYGTPVGVDLVKLKTLSSGEVGYVWLELTDFNIAYWAGQTSSYVKDVYFPSGTPELAASSTSIAFSMPTGATAAPKAIDIGIVGAGTGMWSIGSPSESWLRTIPSATLSDTLFMPGRLTLSVDASGLQPGVYTADVTVSAELASSTVSKTIHVTLTVTAPTPPCTSAPFSDVPIDHPFCPEITWMKDQGISTGYDDGTYRPNAVVTRMAMSAFMARLAGATPEPCTSAPFSDVPIDHPFCPEITWMKDQGISTGYDDGTYRPNAVVTRMAMSAFMARLAGATPEPCTSAPFSDVPIDHPFCPEITWMKDQGISTGYDDGTYRPNADITRMAMSAFMWRVHWLIA